MDSTRKRLHFYLSAFIGVILFSTVSFMVIEDLPLSEAFYFSIVTMSTVGYGDIHPSSPLGRIFAIVLIFLGVGTFLGVVASATETMLNRRERQHLKKKRNMLIGIFFSEVGLRFITLLSEMDPNISQVKQLLLFKRDWTDRDFLNARKQLVNYRFDFTITDPSLEKAREILKEKKEHLIRLLENPGVLEHEQFTELLLAVFHLSEELSCRCGIDTLPETDRNHLLVDMRRIYSLLLDQWLEYNSYLQKSYPYLYSLAVRTNPCDQKSTPLVD